MVSVCPSRPDVRGPGVDDRSVTMGDRTLIIAANGRVASRVAAQLNAMGEAPDVLVRDAAKARRVLVDERGRPTYRDLFVGELTNDEHQAVITPSLRDEPAG